MEGDVTALAGDAHARNADRPGYRWGMTRGRVGFQGGSIRFSTADFRSGEYPKSSSYPALLKIREK